MSTQGFAQAIPRSVASDCLPIEQFVVLGFASAFTNFSGITTFVGNGLF